MLILAQQNDPISGYDLAKLLEEKTGNKPSSGKIYPFLHQLEENNFIEEVELDEDSDRSKIVYKLTTPGESLVDELLDRMGNILDARLERMLDVCASCDVKLYEAEEEGVDVHGKPVKFCCSHCKHNYYKRYNLHED